MSNKKIATLLATSMLAALVGKEANYQYDPENQNYEIESKKLAKVLNFDYRMLLE